LIAAATILIIMKSSGDADDRANAFSLPTEVRTDRKPEIAAGALRPARGFSIAGAAAAVGGVAMVVGSTQEWATFSGGFLSSLIDRSGIELGYGVVTLLCGVGVSLIGLGAATTRGVTRFRWWAMTLSVIGLAIVVLAYAVLALRIGEMDSEFGGFLSHGEGLYAVGIGAATGAIAASRLRRTRTQREGSDDGSGRHDGQDYAAQGFVKVEMSDDYGNVETPWAERVPDSINQLRLDNSPFFAYRVSANDIIEGEEVAPGFYRFVRVVRRSGNRTVRLMFGEKKADTPEGELVLNAIVRMGCTYEGAFRKLLSITVPPDVALEAVAAYLTATGLDWEYADPTYSDLLGQGSGEL
jgi:hypothetical protein